MDIRGFIAKQDWIFAKTYAKRCPHEYIVRGRINGTDEEFIEFAETIQKYGQTMWFWSTPNKYIYVDGYYYWVMTDNMHTKGDVTTIDLTDPTTIINRSKAQQYTVSIKWKGFDL